MSLNPEWLRRVTNWRDELPQHFYRPLGVIALSGFVTKEQLTAEQAQAVSFAPMPAGTRWGAKWEYGWFKGAITLPAAAAGQRIALRADAGGESAVWINGRLVGAVDRQHTEITLALAGEAGAGYDILIEAYAGHGLRTAGKGPVGYGRASVPEPPPSQVVVGETTFGVWNEPVYQLWLDVETLLQTRNQLDPDSLRVAEIDAGLRDFTLIADPELPPAEFLATVEQARARLKPLLACVNGPTAPTLFAIGHSHIDVAWLWPLQETERKMARTISTQLALMDEYPEFKFIQSQPHLFWMLQRRYPAKYAEVKAAIQAGKIVPEGGMWIEADTNISGGEALIRQFVAGKRFFKQEFGVGNELMWLPDVFGYSGAMPQIMKGCGIKYFATQKIFWTYNGGDQFPYNMFWWEGIDGTKVISYIHNDYN
ncbi:MAG: alpha-mannosidase, partial [Chloroflexota bacterium]|nr:alpha-mannosidase [Chloroflexota bacterium]